MFAFCFCAMFTVIHSPLACVPQNRLNEHCQWRVANGTGGFYTLDLSSLSGDVIHIHPEEGNGYEHYYSPCQNGLRCPQQVGGEDVMSMTENHETGTCDHYLAIWEDGRVQPIFHDERLPTDSHWEFQYWNGQKCSTGELGEYIIRYFCDPDVDTYKVLGESDYGGCRFGVNISTSLACKVEDQRISRAYQL